MLARKISSAIAINRLLATGKRASAIDAGARVNTIVFTRPIRHAREDATRFEAEEMMVVTKKRLPSMLSSRPNFVWKK